MLKQYEPEVIEKILDIFIKYRVHFLRTRNEDDTLLIAFARLGKDFSYKAYVGLKKILAQKNIDVNYQNCYKYTALLYVLLNNIYRLNPKSEEMMSLLLDYGADITCIDEKLVMLYSSRRLLFQSTFFEMLIRRMFLANQSLNPYHYYGFKYLLLKERFIDTAAYYLTLNKKTYSEQRAFFIYFLRTNDTEVVALLINSSTTIDAYLGSELLCSSVNEIVQAGLNSFLEGKLSLMSGQGELDHTLLNNIIKAIKL